MEPESINSKRYNQNADTLQTAEYDFFNAKELIS
jgi:hypothetical protein